MNRLLKFSIILPLLLSSCSSNNEKIVFVSNYNEFDTYYDDSYFLGDNHEYDQGIAVASYASAMASIDGNEDYSLRGQHVANLWKKEGFENIYISESYAVEPTIDSIAYCIASKKIEDFNLVTLVVRSGYYAAEWGSNFTLGETGHAKGFYNSSVVVVEGLKQYLTQYNIQGHTKFWISGYSRGGSVANLTTMALLQNIKDNTFVSGVTTSLEDVYAYCFEPTNCVDTTLIDAEDEMYDCIHIILNFNDLIPMIVPTYWGFTILGQKHYYPDRITDINFNNSERRKLLSNYHFTPGAHKFPEYTVDNWKFYDPGYDITEERNLPRESLYPSQGRFVRNFTFELFSSFLTRDYYYLFEDYIRATISGVFGQNEDIGEINLTADMIIDIIFSYSFIQNVFVNLQANDFYGFALDIEFLFYKIFGANESNIEAIREIYNALFYLILFIGPSIVSRGDLMLQFLSRDNILSLFTPHYTEINYSFLLSCDERLYGDSACKLNDGSYQVLHVVSPTYISIFESTLNKTVFSYSDGEMISDTLSAEKLADGSIDIYLPNNGEYSYNIESNGISLGKVNDIGTEETIKDSMPKEGTF